MKIERFIMGAKGKLAKAVKNFDIYIDYYEKAKGEKPKRLSVSNDVYDEIAKKASKFCEDNRLKRDGILTYQDLEIRRG